MTIRDADISYLYSVDDQRMYKEIAAPSEVKREYYLSDAIEEEALLPKTERRTFCSKARGKVIALHSSVTPTGQSTTTKWEYYAHGSEREARLVPVYSGAKFTLEEVSFYVYDHLGNTRLSYIPRYRAGTSVVQDSIITVTDYYPYGKVLREYVNGEEERYLTTQHSMFRFIGKRDEETGLDYRGARYYDSDIGRFLSLDPLATKYPSMSAYNYVAGNPIVLIDSDGREIVIPKDIRGKERRDFKRLLKTRRRESKAFDLWYEQRKSEERVNYFRPDNNSMAYNSNGQEKNDINPPGMVTLHPMKGHDQYYVGEAQYEIKEEVFTITFEIGTNQIAEESKAEMQRASDFVNSSDVVDVTVNTATPATTQQREKGNNSVEIDGKRVDGKPYSYLLKERFKVVRDNLNAGSVRQNNTTAEDQGTKVKVRHRVPVNQ